jgi:type VI secretion system protein ImpM
VTGSAAIGFFGKIPAQGDFVRANVGDPLVQRFTRWLEEASEACHKTRAQVPRQPVRFLFRAAGEARALLGALRGSQDRVGRQFPLAAFAPVAGRLVEKGFPAAPLAYAGLLSALSDAIAEDPPSPAALSEKPASPPRTRRPGPTRPCGPPRRGRRASSSASSATPPPAAATTP